MVRLVLLSGGSGTRLWPLSTSLNPKQFHELPFGVNETLLEQSIRRGRKLGTERPLLVISDKHQFKIKDVSLDVIIEPMERDSGPACIIAALACEQSPDEPIIVSPCDHYITDEDNYVDILSHAANVAVKERCISTIGVEPSHANTNLGYIQCVDKKKTSYVKKFTEKPKREYAQELINSGALWNVGVFAFTPRTLLEICEELNPELLHRCRNAFNGGMTELLYSSIPKISFDYAIAEKCQRMVVTRCPNIWYDVGTFKSLRECSLTDGNGNAGNGGFFDSRDCLIASDIDNTCVIGCKNIAVMYKNGYIVVYDTSSSSDYKLIVKQIVSK